MAPKEVIGLLLCWSWGWVHWDWFRSGVWWRGRRVYIISGYHVSVRVGSFSWIGLKVPRPERRLGFSCGGLHCGRHRGRACCGCWGCCCCSCRCQRRGGGGRRRAVWVDILGVLGQAGRAKDSVVNVRKSVHPGEKTGACSGSEDWKVWSSGCSLCEI